MKLSLALALISVTAAAPALAIECPGGMTSCKVLAISPQEEAILTQPQGVLATAAEARKVDYAGFVQYFLQRIKEAPAGEPAKPQEKPPEKKPEFDGNP